MPWVSENIPAIVQMTHASQEQGNALADVLFGIENPGGKTVQTWPKSINHLPPMMDYDIRNGRTYMYSQWEPQYAFGYGLSYTTFEMNKLELSQAEAKMATRLRLICRLLTRVNWMETKWCNCMRVSLNHGSRGRLNSFVI